MSQPIPEFMNGVRITLDTHVADNLSKDRLNDLSIDELRVIFIKAEIPLPKSSKNKEFYRKMMVAKLIKSSTPKNNGVSTKISCKALKNTSTYKDGKLRLQS